MDIKNRILNMTVTPMFQRVSHHGDFSMTEPDWDLPIEVMIEYYDGRRSRCVVADQKELEILKLYHKNNMENWKDDEEYD